MSVAGPRLSIAYKTRLKLSSSDQGTSPYSLEQKASLMLIRYAKWSEPNAN